MKTFDEFLNEQGPYHVSHVVKPHSFFKKYGKDKAGD